VTFPGEVYKGLSHNAILLDNGIYYIVYHAYNAKNNGVSELCIASLLCPGIMRVGSIFNQKSFLEELCQTKYQ
jgi:hypothetical protein